MIVLSRKKHEAIQIGDLITVEVVGIRDDEVRLRVSCPHELPVFRGEMPPSHKIESFRAYAGESFKSPLIARRKDESLCIGNDISIVVVDIRRGMVRLGVDLPDNISVHRREIYNDLLEARPELGIEIYVDPGGAKKETIQGVLECLSDLHIAAGGLGLEFIADDLRIQSTEGVVN